MNVPKFTADQKNHVTELLKKYEIEPDNNLYDLIQELSNSMAVISMLFDGDIEADRRSLANDNKRIKRIFSIINEFENEGLKRQFLNLNALFVPHLERPYFLPAVNEFNRYIVKSCSVIAIVLTDRGYFKSRNEKRSLYLFLSELVNIVRPGTFPADRFGELLTDGVERSFRNFLFTFSPNPPAKRKLKP